MLLSKRQDTLHGSMESPGDVGVYMQKKRERMNQ
jgi:hypothetical protein